MQVSIPLESGHIVILKKVAEKATAKLVSIPLESGHIVMNVMIVNNGEKKHCFNPLRIGSYCNRYRNNVKKYEIRKFQSP